MHLHLCPCTRPCTNQCHALMSNVRVLQEMQLDMVLGYRGFDCRNNLHYLNDGTDVVYHAAGAGIVLNLSSGTDNSLILV